MPSHPTLPLRAVVGAVVALAVLLGGCGDAEPELVMQGSIPLGQVWDGPEKRRYSQGNEELVVRDFFEDRRGGVFLDVGSAHPIEGSTTYYLEKHLGWSGVAIDALSEYAGGYRSERPATRFFSYIVTDISGTRESFYRVQGAALLSSTEPDRSFGGTPLATNTVKVETTTIDRLLSAQGIEEIDFLSMDIEGGEARALAGFDIDRYRPALVCIEVEEANDEAVSAYFSSHGYERLERYSEFDFVNRYYAPVDAAGDQGDA